MTDAPAEAVGNDTPAASSFGQVDLRIRGLSKSFDGKPVFDNVDLDIAKGEAVALIGSNGAGKSTLLRCCLRLIEPDRGRISLLHHNVTTLPSDELRRLRATVGFVFQRHNLVPRLSVLTNVVQGAQGSSRGMREWFHWLAPAAIRKRAMHCLDQVGLAHLADRRSDTLSGGQSQRVAIARALMQRPKIVLADEPVASLDPSAGEEVMRLFLQLIRQERLTLFFTCHNLEHALTYADRVVGLKGGKIELDARSRALDAAYLKEIYA